MRWGPSQRPARSGAPAFRPWTRKVKEAVKVLPLPTSLWTSMVPPIMSAMFFAMVSPRPTPWTPLRVEFCSLVKGLNISSRNSGLMPIPLSATDRRYTVYWLDSSSPSTAEMVTSPPGLV